jgi:hypothetical protein
MPDLRQTNLHLYSRAMNYKPSIVLHSNSNRQIRLNGSMISRWTRMQRNSWHKRTQPPTTNHGNRESEFHGSLDVGVPKTFKCHSVFPTLSFSVISKITFKHWIPHVYSDSERNPIRFVSGGCHRLAHLRTVLKFTQTVQHQEPPI